MRTRWRNSAEGYGRVSRLLHWSIALGIFGLVGLGWYMVGLTYFDPLYHTALSWHKAVGMAVLLLGALFLAWKLISPSPPHPASLGRLQQQAAGTVHVVLVLMILTIPLTGYLISTSDGKPIELAWGLAVPALFTVETWLRDLAIEVHFWCAYGTAILAMGHAGAALKHQFIDRDGILSRMLWGR